MKPPPYIRNALRPIYGSDDNKCIIEVLDFAQISQRTGSQHANDDNASTSTLVAAILRPKRKKTALKKHTDISLFVFWLENYEAAVRDVLLNKTTELDKLGLVFNQSADKTSVAVLKGQLWSLYHDTRAICANWKKNHEATATLHRLFLATLTESYMAYIWRFNELQDAFEICIQIPLQTVDYDLNFRCLWINLETVEPDYNFSSRAFVIFYNTTATSNYSLNTDRTETETEISQRELDSGPSTPKHFLSNYFNSLELTNQLSVECDDDYETENEDFDELEGEEDSTPQEDVLFDKHEDYTQYFEIYAVDGLFNHHLAVTSDYLLGSNEIMMPIKIKAIESVSICNHTFETGLVTLYTSDSLRPNKITTKSPIVVSKWITVKSTNLTGVHSQPSEAEGDQTRDRVHELIGMQISKGLNKILPPITLKVLNQNDVSMHLLLSPYDLFLKDEHIKESVDNIVGLVIRYMFHPSTPLYVNIDGEFVYAENHFINRIKSSKKVKNVKVFSDKDETLYIIHHANGTLNAITTKKHDPNDITHHRIHNLKHVSTFEVVEYQHQLHLVIFTPFECEGPDTPWNTSNTGELVDVEGLYNCGLYKWENYKLNLKGKWLFKSPKNTWAGEEREDAMDDAILQFKKWYDSHYFCLLSKFELIGDPGDGEADDAWQRDDARDEADRGEPVYLYMMKRNKILKWLEINDRYYFDLLTNNKYYLVKTHEQKQYELDHLDVVIRSARGADGAEGAVLDKLPLFMGCNFKNQMYPIYHPECVLTLIKLGLLNLVGKLVNMLVFVFRKILGQLKSDIYCVNTNPYDAPEEEPEATEDGEKPADCNCIIYKTLKLKLFCKFNRFFYDYVIKNVFQTAHAAHPQHDAHATHSTTRGQYHTADAGHADTSNDKNIMFDYVADDEYNEYLEEFCRARDHEELRTNELVVYLQVIRMIGLAWYEQYQLINILLKHFPTHEGLLLFSNPDAANAVRELAEDEDRCKLCNNADVLLKIATSQKPSATVFGKNILRYLVTHIKSLTNETSYYNAYATNKNVVELDALFLAKFREHLDERYGRHRQLAVEGSPGGTIREGTEEDAVVWLLLVKNDQNLLRELNAYHTNAQREGDPAAGERDYMEFMDAVKVGFWIKKPTLKALLEEVERHFRTKIKGYAKVEDFDHFGFYLILQGKARIYAALLKTKGFEKLANFLTNDFTQERWREAAVKNAFALIAQRRHLLSAAMLVLAGKVQDAVDVVFQYMGNLSLCLLVSKVLDFDLSYSFRKVASHKVKYVLERTHALQMAKSGSHSFRVGGGSQAGGTPWNAAPGPAGDDLSKEVELLCEEDEEESGPGAVDDAEDDSIIEPATGTVDELLLNVCIGIVLRKVDLATMEKMIRNSSKHYLDKMPIVSVLLHSLLTNYTSWDKILIYASNFLHFQKFNTFSQSYDYLDYANEGRHTHTRRPQRHLLQQQLLRRRLPLPRR